MTAMKSITANDDDLDPYESLEIITLDYLMMNNNPIHLFRQLIEINN